MDAVARSTYGQACGVNFDWSWCPPAEPGRTLDLTIALGSLGPYDAKGTLAPYRVRLSRDPSRPPDDPIVRVERGIDGHFRVRYCDGAEFAIDATGCSVFGVSRSDLTLDDLLVYLQGPILGFVLRLRGVTCLHASAAVVDGRALAVVGAGGMGKSTSAATFARAGVPVLTDDVLALADRGAAFDVQPGLPRVLLWSESVRALFGDPEALPRVVGNWDKRYLDLRRPGYLFADRRAPLGAIYVLGERLPRGERPRITALSGAGALVHLVANTYANDFLDGAQRARELEVLGRLVNHVPVRLVRAPDDPGQARDTCEAMIADLRELA
jgi:hypothetical protein